jgi:hypothetical protein
VAHLLDGRREVGDGGVEANGFSRLAVGSQPCLGGTQRDADGDEPLLSAVVEVALDATPLLIGGARDAGAGSVQFGELAVEVDAEPGDLDGAAYRGVALWVVGRSVLDEHVGGAVQAHRRTGPGSGSTGSPWMSL